MNNLSALSRGDLNYVHGNNAHPVIRILRRTIPPAGHNTIIVSATNCSVSSIASVITTNYGTIVFAANHNAYANGTVIPILGIATGTHACRRVRSGVSISLDPVIHNRGACRRVNTRVLGGVRSVYGNGVAGTRTFNFSSVTISRIYHFIWSGEEGYNVGLLGG